MEIFVPQETFMNKLMISVKKKQKIELTKEQGWYSVAELEELGWSKQGTQCTMWTTYHDRCMFSHVLSVVPAQTYEIKPTNPPRTKIEGAQTKCKALGESHFRQGLWGMLMVPNKFII